MNFSLGQIPSSKRNFDFGGKKRRSDFDHLKSLPKHIHNVLNQNLKIWIC